MAGPGRNYCDYVYHNGQLPSALWYHDHVMGITRLNIFAGLVGLYLLRDRQDTGGPPAVNPARPRPGENSLGPPGPPPATAPPRFMRFPW